MNEDQLIALLSSLDDDLVDKEIDSLLEGVDINMDSIREKANEKLNAKRKKIRLKKAIPYVAAVCIGAVGITTVYGADVSKFIQSFFNVTPVYSTIVDGKAYYLKEPHVLNEHIKIKSVMVAKGKLEMQLSTDLDLEKSDELESISIIAKDKSDIVYSAGGYMKEDGGTYFLSFMNKIENNYAIEPFKDFKFSILGESYDISLDEAQSFDTNSQIYSDGNNEEKLKGINIGAKRIDGGDKLNIQLVAAFDDKDLKIAKFGTPIQAKVISHFEDLGEKGMIGSSTGATTKELYVFDESGNKYELEIPKDATGSPVTVFETSAPKDKALTLKLPSVIVSYEKSIEKLSIAVPQEGEITLNKDIDLNIQKARLKSVKRLSETSVEITFDLNIGDNNKIAIRDFDLHCPQAKKIDAEFEGDKAVAKVEFGKNIDTTDLEIAWPHFAINGDWVIDIPKP